MTQVSGSKNPVKSVTFGLAPLGTPELRLTAKPYQFGTKGWGTFEIPIKIEWRSDVASTELKH